MTDSPTDTNGANNGCSCGAGPHPSAPDLCERGHFLPENRKRGESEERYVDERRDKVIPARDRHLHDLGWTPDTAPQYVLDACTFAAEIPIRMDKARRGNRMSTYTSLLDRYSGFIRALDSMKSPARAHGVQDSVSHEELVARLMAMAAALGTDDDEVRELQHRIYIRTSAEENRARWREQLARLDAASESPAPIPEGNRAGAPRIAETPQNPKQNAHSGETIDSEPVVYVHHHRITERDVLACLRGFGDATLEDYERGRLTKKDAYEMTRHWLKEQDERKDWRI